MSVINRIKGNFLRAAMFFDVQSCVAFQGTCRAGRAFFAGDDTWQKEVVAVLKGIEGQFTPLEPETRALLRQRMVFYPADIRFVQTGVKQIRAVCDEMRKEGLKAQDAAVVLRHAVTMTTPYCHLPVHPVLASLEGGLQGKGKIEVLDNIAVLTQGDKRVAKLMTLDGKEKWKWDARDYLQRTLNICCAAYETAAAMGSRSVAPTHALKDGTVVQYYIPNSSTFSRALYIAKNIKQFSSINIAEAQLHMLTTLIRGRQDGHMANTVLSSDCDNLVHLYDIDEELDFPVINGEIRNGCEQRAPSTAVMGLPQAGIPLLKSILLLFSLPGWKEKCLKILQRHGLLDSIAACAVRCDKIRAICLAELQRENSKITPRDFYFAIYGKDYLFEMAVKHKLPPIIFFSGRVSTDDDLYSTGTPLSQPNIFESFCRGLESLPSPPQFSLAGPGNEKYPGQTIFETVVRHFSEKAGAIRCLEVPSETFDAEGWAKYQKENHFGSVTMDSFMLSHFLQGFPKRVARMLSRVYPYYPLIIIKDESGKLWLELSPTPLIQKFRERWLKNQEKHPLDVMKLEPHQVSLYALKELRPTFFEKTPWLYDITICLEGDEMKFLGSQIRLFHTNGYLDIDQRPDGIFLVFKYLKKEES